MPKLRLDEMWWFLCKQFLVIHCHLAHFRCALNKLLHLMMSFIVKSLNWIQLSLQNIFIFFITLNLHHRIHLFLSKKNKNYREYNWSKLMLMISMETVRMHDDDDVEVGWDFIKINCHKILFIVPMSIYLLYSIFW